MGFSYTFAAGVTMTKIERACMASRHGKEDEKISNVFHANGRSYFYELRRRDRADGGLGGEIRLYLPDGVHVRKVGTFRIDGKGRVVRGPALFRDAAVTA